MKKVIFCISLLAPLLSLSQVIIGGTTGSAGTDTQNVLLDFPTGKNEGIILPYVRTLPASPTPGTIMVDASASGNNGGNARVVYWNGIRWVDLSNGNTADLPNMAVNGGTQNVMAIQPGVGTPENANSKVVLGKDTSAADGVLVLEGQANASSDTRALVLPKVTSTDNIKDPAPGMMVFVTQTLGKPVLAVFNGAKWTYWQPSK